MMRCPATDGISRALTLDDGSGSEAEMVIVSGAVVLPLYLLRSETWKVGCRINASGNCSEETTLLTFF